MQIIRKKKEKRKEKPLQNKRLTKIGSSPLARLAGSKLILDNCIFFP